MDKNRCLTEVQQGLVEKNMKLVDWIIYEQYYPNNRIAGFSREDLQQTGYLGLCKAALSYRGQVLFSTYAKQVIRHELAEHCRQFLPEQNCQVSLDAPRRESQDGSYYDCIPCLRAQQTWESMEAWDLWDRCKACCKGSNRYGLEVLELRQQGYSDTDIARISGRKRAQISKWVSRARNRLKSDPMVKAALTT